MKRFITFAVLSIVSIGLTKLILIIFNLGEMDWI